MPQRITSGIIGEQVVQKETTVDQLAQEPRPGTRGRLRPPSRQLGHCLCRRQTVPAGPQDEDGHLGAADTDHHRLR
jgi:hypothetical protein